MMTLILADMALLVSIALAGQILVTLVLCREAVLTKEGMLCRVNCTVADLMYGAIATLLAVYFFG